MTNHLFDGLFYEADPTAPFAVLPQGRTISYQDVFDSSAQLAQVLIELNVKPGDRVAAQVPKTIEAVFLYLACLRCGATFLPLNTAYTAAELAYFVEDSGAKLLICNPENEQAYQEISTATGCRIETLGASNDLGFADGSMTERAAGRATQIVNVDRDAGDLAAILYTSGTTGRSKGAMLSHDNLLSNAQALVELWQFTRSDVLLHALPIFHTHGLFVAVNTSLLAGSSMIFLPSFNLDAVIEKLPDSSTMMGVPTFYTRLLGDDRFNRDLVAHMRLFVSGSAPLLADTHVEFEQRTGHRVLERYGMTETNMNTSNPFDGERRAGTVGFPLPGVRVRVCEAESGSEVLQGEVGVLEVSGPNVFAGYWNMPEKTAAEFRSDGFFITGDLSRIDEDGYVHIVGRSKDLIISGGLNIYPKEIELAIDEQDGVLESAVVGVPHPDFGEAVVAVVVPSSASMDPDAVLAGIGDQLARFKQPKRIHVVEELPRNTMGKVQKNVLRDELNDLFSTN